MNRGGIRRRKSNIFFNQEEESAITCPLYGVQAFDCWWRMTADLDRTAAAGRRNTPYGKRLLIFALLANAEYATVQALMPACRHPGKLDVCFICVRELLIHQMTAMRGDRCGARPATSRFCSR